MSDIRDGPGATLPAAIITGASEGIGYEIARCLAGKDADRFLLVARGGAALEKAGALLRDEFSVQVAVLAIDLLDPSAGEKIDARLVEMGWHAEILVNNAGMGLSGAFLGQPAEAVQRLMELNMTVPVALSRRFLPGMCARKSGGIFNVASLGGYVPGPGQAVYYASKAFLISFSKAVRHEVRGSGVRVTVVVPGPVETGFHRKMHAEGSRYRRVLPAARSWWVAWTGVAGFRLGVSVVFPGPLSAIFVLASRLTPNFILAPIMGWLLGPENPRK